MGAMVTRTTPLARVALLGLLGLLGMSRETPQRGGVLNIALSSPIQSLTAATTHHPDLIAAGPMYDALLTYDRDLEPKPWLAKSWTVSEDGRTYTFELERHVTWHDGKPFTSADVKFTIEEILRKYHPSGAVLWANVGSIETPDPHTVVFKLAQPSAVFIKILGPYHVKIMPQHIYEGKGFLRHPANRRPVGTGPFKFREHRRGSYLIVERNPNYWKKGLPYLDRIVSKVFPNAAARIAALENGEVDLIPIYMPVHEIPRVEKNPKFAVTAGGYEGGAGVCMLKLNLRRKPLSDLKVRQALSYALDKDVIHKLAGYGYRRRTDGFIPRGIRDWYNEDQTTYEHDIEKANQLLDEAGFPKGAGGIRFELQTELAAGHLTHIRNCEVAKEQLKKVGIDMVLNMRDVGSHLDIVYNKWDFDLAIAGHGIQFDPALGGARYLTTEQAGKVPFTNGGGYSNPRVDELFAKVRIETDPETRREMFYEIQEILARDIPVIWLYDFPNPTAYNRDLVGIPMGPSSWGENYATVGWKQGARE